MKWAWWELGSGAGVCLEERGTAGFCEGRGGAMDES